MSKSLRKSAEKRSARALELIREALQDITLSSSEAERVVDENEITINELKNENEVMNNLVADNDAVADAMNKVLKNIEEEE